MTWSTGGACSAHAGGAFFPGFLAPCAVFFEGLPEQTCEPTGASEGGNLHIQLGVSPSCQRPPLLIQTVAPFPPSRAAIPRLGGFGPALPGGAGGHQSDGA